MKKYEIPGEQALSGIILFSCLISLTLIYHATAANFFKVWIADNGLQSHGLLLLPISCYILVREWFSKRGELSIQFRPLYLIALAILSLAWLLSDIAQIQLVSQILLIFILCLVVFALFGVTHTGKLVFPILILLSATPIWSVLAQPLQEPTAFFVNQMLHLTGYTSFQREYYIDIPEGVFEVGDTCSGLRYQVAAITLSILYAFFAQYSLSVAMLYILFASAVAFISNSIRIYIVVLSGHYTNMTHSLLDDHIWLGWVVFVFCYAGFMYVTVLVEKRIKITSNRDAERSIAKCERPAQYGRYFGITSAILICASIGPLYHTISLGGRLHDTAQTSQVQLTLDGLGLRQAGDSNSWMPKWQNADSELRASYLIDGQKLDFYSAYYSYQVQGKEAVNDLNRAYNTDRWKADRPQKRVISLPSGRDAEIMERIITDRTGKSRIVWRWYYIGGYITSGTIKSKLYGIIAGLMGRNDAAVIVLSVAYKDDVIAARSAMYKFVNECSDEIEKQYGMSSRNP
ncbi:MAG: EpsI family protein [Candidatus Thiodiazotropha sp.]|jgi:EpsI family protein